MGLPWCGVSRRSSIIIFWGQGTWGRTPVRKPQSSLFLWGASLNFHPLYYLYLQEGDCPNTKEHYFAKDTPEHVVFYFSHCMLCSRGYRPTKFKISPQSLFLQRMSSKRKSHPMKILSDCHLFPSHRQPTGLQQNIFRWSPCPKKKREKKTCWCRPWWLYWRRWWLCKKNWYLYWWYIWKRLSVGAVLGMVMQTELIFTCILWSMIIIWVDHCVRMMAP